MNEEEVKNRIILPYLDELGFELHKMSFEKNFTIRLGRYKHKIGKTVEEQARGKLDILVTYNGKNLFIIETKEEDHDITQDDIDQAISYSRLLEEMAPIRYCFQWNINQDI